MTEAEQIWADLKIKLNLTDEDLDVGYKVQIDNGLAIMGWLSHGKIARVPKYYPHPSAAKAAGEAYCAKTGHKFKILKWNPEADSLLPYEK